MLGSKSIMSQRKKPLRILYVIDSLNIGGTERQCVETVKRMNDSKYNIQLVTLDKNGGLLQEAMDAHILLTEFKISGAFYQPRSLIQIIKLALFMKKNKFHIVQTYGFYSTIPGVIAAKIARVPIVIAGKRDMSELISRFQVKVEKMLWRLCDKIVVNANGIRNYLIEKDGIQKEKIVTIHNGVDLEQFGSKSENVDNQLMPNIVGMVANFRPQKDHSVFLEAAEIVLKRKNDVKFYLIGSGVFEEEMKEYAKQLCIQNSVDFYGKKTAKELHSIMKRFAISVLASTNEGTPNVILEAMALGKPVIANPSGGVPELVEDEVTGYLFPYKRADLLAEKIICLLDNINVAKEMGRNGRKKVERLFNYTVMMSRYEKLYEELIRIKVGKNFIST